MADKCPPAVKYGIPILSVVAVALIIGLTTGSLQVLLPTQVGFVFDQNSQTIDLTTLYGPGGRHFVGLGKRFVVYPTNLLMLEFSDDPNADAPPIDVFTKDGQTVALTCSIMVSLVRDQLAALYHLYGENAYSLNFINIGATTIRNTAAANFVKEDYFQNRARVGLAFQQAVEAQFALIYGQVTYFQLRRIDLPASLEQAISTNIVTAQQSKTSQAQQAATVIRKQTQVDVTAGNLILNQQQTTTQINNTNAIQTATAQANQIIQQAEGTALLAARTALGLTDQDNSVLLNWLYMRTLQNLNGTDLWVGFSSFTQTLPSQ